MLQELSTASEIAVDLEHHSYRTFLGITCLVQLSTRAKDYIVDALALYDHLGQLNHLFTDPKRDFGVYIVNLFDTRQAARTLRFPRFSLAYLLQRFVGVSPNKAFQLADWRIRETTGMYACCNPVPPLLRKYVSDFHQVVLDARNGKHIEQEIDADVVILESVTPASSSPNVVPSHTTASRSAPHDTLRLATQQTPNANSCQDSLRRNCPTRPSLFGRRFPQSPRPLFEAFIDPSRFVPQKILDAVKSIQVSDRVPVEEDLSFTSTALTPNASVSETKEDRLFKPPPVEHSSVSGGKAPSPIKLTAAEAIEVEDVGAKFCLGSVSFGRSAQCRALANLKNRRQQRNSSPQQSEEFDQNRLPDSQEDDDVSSETDVVMLRDQVVGE
ncbi:Protein RRP6-like 1 [Echinococcus granulosus]|nr:Protein RRP6-like 1 [Echinococcus granulosus]